MKLQHRLACLTGLLVAAATGSASEPALPPATRTWRGAEYLQAAEVLRSGRAPLPRLSEPSGRAMVERMTSTENLSYHRDVAVPLRTRFADLLDVLQGMSAVQHLYQVDCERNCAGKDPSARGELARLRAFTLHVLAAAVELEEGLGPRADGARILDSFDLFAVFSAVEVCLDPAIHAPGDRSRLIAAMATTLPRLETRFTATNLIDLRKKLKARRAQRLGAEDLRAIDGMLAELRTTLTPAWSAEAENPFVEAGVPPPGRAWRGADYARAAELVRSGRAPLPRLSEPQGRAVVERLTSAANFSYHGDRSLPLSVRLADLVEIFESSGALVQRYMAPVRESAAAPEEMGLLLPFVLQLSASLSDRVQEAESTRADITPCDCQEALDAARTIVVKMLYQTRSALVQPGFLSAPDRSALLATLAATIPRTKRVLSDAGRAELGQSVRALGRVLDRPEDLRAIEEIGIELEKR